MKLSNDISRYIQIAIKLPSGKILSFKEWNGPQGISLFENGKLYSIQFRELENIFQERSTSKGKPPFEFMDFNHEIIIVGDDAMDMCCHTDEPFEGIRKKFLRGTKGKEMDPTKETFHVALCDMNNAWLEACIVWNNERGNALGIANELYSVELNYREKNNIFIEENP